MTDATLATYAVVVNEIENEARAAREASDSDERAAADVVSRQAGALRGVLEKWIVKRALRNANQAATAR